MFTSLVPLRIPVSQPRKGKVVQKGSQRSRSSPPEDWLNPLTFLYYMRANPEFYDFVYLAYHPKPPCGFRNVYALQIIPPPQEILLGMVDSRAAFMSDSHPQNGGHAEREIKECSYLKKHVFNQSNGERVTTAGSLQALVYFTLSPAGLAHFRENEKVFR